MKFLSRARGISVKATFCYGFYTFVGIAIIHSVYVKCSDDGAATDFRLELNNTGRSNEAVTDFFEPVGCFKDKPLRALPKQLKLKTLSVDWGNMNSSLATIIHECAEMVNKQYGFQYFALQSYKECWSGVNGSLTYNKHGKASNCYEFGEYGVGDSWSNFVYRFTKVDGMWSHWSPWQACTVTCGVGYRTRTRTCTNPAPKWSGQDCIGMHISSNNCNLDKCKETTVIDSFEPVGCFKDKKDPRAFPILIKSFSKLVNWNNITSSLMAVIRACAEVVQKNYFRYFGVQFYKECWTGVNGSMTYNRHGKSFSCLGVVHGVGKDWTNFVYRFVKVNGKWGNWSPWQPCSVTCGLGNRTRVRACTDPAPKWEGKDCVGLSIASENCSLHECKGKEPTSSAKSSLLAPVLGSSCLMFLCLVGAIFLGLRCLRRRRSNSELPDQWEVVFDDISLCKIIGEGAFGKVYSGEFQKKTDATKSRKITTRRRKEETKEKKNGLKVAVKMLRNGATDEQRQEFLEEIELMKQIGYHRHILNLLACCTTTVPMFLVVEFAKYGDLLNYLRQRREQIKQAAEEVKDETNGCIGYQNMQMIDETNLYDCTSNTNKCTVTSHRTSQNTSGHHNDLGIDTDGLHDEDKLTPADLLTFAWQIAKGMEFLSRKGFVHRDLAARNVLVCEGKLIKVADFGLSRYIYTEKVYHCKKSRKLPIKWMSPEAIYDQVFTTESDVWAYGILLWEMSTIGGTPYPTIANQRLLQALKSGYRMEKPQICTDEMYELMRQCWQEKPEERPSFTFIREQLEQMMLRHCSYLDLSNANQYCHAPCCDSESDEENTSL